VLLDLDLTIRRRHADELEAQVITALAAIRPTYGFDSLNLVTTNTHDLHRFSEPIGANVFQPFRSGGRSVHKPQPAFFDYVLEILHAKPQEAIMIDDRLRIIRGANHIGMYTLLMQPLGHDYLTDRLRLTRFRDQRHLRAARAALAITHEVHKDENR
jgi:predicted HAD superfamily phosphohydrolase YqeG